MSREELLVKLLKGSMSGGTVDGGEYMALELQVEGFQHRLAVEVPRSVATRELREIADELAHSMVEALERQIRLHQLYADDRAEADRKLAQAEAEQAGDDLEALMDKLTPDDMKDEMEGPTQVVDARNGI